MGIYGITRMVRLNLKAIEFEYQTHRREFLVDTNPYNILVVADSNNLWVTPESLNLLKSIGAVITLDLLSFSDNNERVKVFDELLSSSDMLISAPWGRQNMPNFTAQRLDNAPKLKVISGTFDFRFEGWLDISDAKRRGIRVIDTSRSMTPTVSEFALAMILNLLRNIPYEIDRVRQGEWLDDWYALKGFVSGDLTGRRIGLAGFGSICRRLSELLKPFHCEMFSYDPYVTDEILRHYAVSRAESLEKLASLCEIFVVGIPPMPNTIKIINEKVINALPNGSLFVLVTRMAVVDQIYLWRRISKGEIRAAIDVFDPEPLPIGSPIRTEKNILPTPHLAGNAAFAHNRCFRTACEDAVAAITGKSCKYEVTNWDVEVYAGKI